MGNTKIAICLFLFQYITEFYRNFQMKFIVLNGGFKISQIGMFVAKTAICATFS